MDYQNFGINWPSLDSLSADLSEYVDVFQTSKSFKPLISVSVGAAVLASYLWFRHKNKDSFHDLPQRNWLWGHMKFYNNNHGHGKMFTKLNESTNYRIAYMRAWLGGNHRLILFGLEELKELFNVHGQQSIGRNFGLKVHSAPKGIIDSSGPVWKNNRRIFLNHLRIFGRERQLNLVLDEANHLTDALESVGENCDPTVLLQSAVCNVIASLIFGSRFEYFDPEAEKIFQSILKINNKLNLMPNFLFAIFRSISKTAKSRIRAVESTKAFIKERIQERMKAGIQVPAETLIDAYAVELGKAEWGNDIDNLINVIFELFFAGTETTSTSLAWVLACLTANPEVQTKIVNEVQSFIGDSKLTIQSLRDMTYVTAVQFEVQRFGCIAQNTLPHRMVEDVKLESGQIVKKDVVVWPSLYHPMHDPKYFKYPYEFNPENFLNNDGELETNEAFIPYGIGPRVCLGQILADLELKVFMIEILRKFKVSSNDQINLNHSVQGITCAPVVYTYNFEPRS